MTETIFWDLINQSKAETIYKPDQFFNTLEEKLCRLDGDQILRFDMILHEVVRVGFRSNLLAAAYIINAGADLEDFQDFLGYLIIQGKEVWDNALKNPDFLADVEIEDEASCAKIWEIPSISYERVTGEEDFEMVHFDYMPNNLIGSPELWHDSNNKVDKNKLKELLPRLYEKWWE